MITIEVSSKKLSLRNGGLYGCANQNGFNSAEITQLMIEISETGEAKGVVIILDTLKKFTTDA